jgi:LPS-assembly protein
MRGAHLRRVIPAWRAIATGVAAVALSALVLSHPAVSFAANSASMSTDAGQQINLPFPVAKISKDEKMLVESDQMVYDYDRDTVSAVGNVKIYYAGYTLQAEKVAYNKKTGRLVASGNVKLTDPSGANFYAENFDITDDFRDGFVQSLRVDTPDRTHFAAESAQRSGGETTTFTNGVYTACEPCIEHPEKPPLWNVKAAKIVVDHKAQMVYFTDAQMEFFGLPVAYFPYFGIPDPSVKRKSGLLMPNAGYSAHVGAFLSVPYYWAPAPNYDVTFTPTVYSRQGLMGAVEWRHRVDNGQYTLKGAGIYQLDPGAFADKPGDRRFRGSLRTTGEFYINKDWTFGWDGTLSSDRTFTRDYDIINTDTSETISTAHLTGINGRNFFEARASYYQILTDPDFAPASHPGQYDQSRQAWTAPVIDYHRIASDQVLGGELSFTTNIANVVRQDDDQFDIDPPTADWRFAGTAGTTVRATQEVDWQRRIIGPMGQVIVPFASLRGDAFFMGGQSADAIAQGLTPDDSAFRFMPAVGVDWSLPILATAGGSTHIFEPKVQIIARPNEMDSGTLPNNDAQSLVFDDSNLFDHDKFSGYDRVEGGTRANVGIHYNGSFANGASIDGTFGQSIQLAGANPFATDPVSNVGANSGLETKYSDYVGGVTVDSGFGPRFGARGRFDNADFNLNRGELQATTALGPVTASASYLYLRHNQDDPDKSSSVLRGAASMNLSDNWRAFGTLTYDLVNTAIAGDSFGIAFDNECLTLSIAYSETHENYSDSPNRWLNFRLQLRTFGEGNVSTNLNKMSN